MILSGQSIRERGIVTPFAERQRAYGMTYGCGPAGYDVRIAQDLILRPGEFKLASIIEHLEIPRDVLGKVHDKSTWARMGLALQNTVLEPGWYGFTTLELTNHGANTLTLVSGMPIAQIIFHLTDRMTEGYEGKYQGQQEGPQPAILESC